MKRKTRKKQPNLVQFVPDADVKTLLTQARSRGYTTRFLLNSAVRELLVNNMPAPLGQFSQPA